jgi:glucose/arabinose dehydrogenase
VNSGGGTAGDGSPCGSLFAATTSNGGVAPTNTVSALLNVMRDPVTNAGTLFNLQAAAAPFQPALTAAPANWTLAIAGQGAPAAVPNGCSAADLTGSGAFTDYTKQQPQVCRKITVADLPAPNTNASVTNYSTQVARAAGQMPIVPPGFKVTLYASGFVNPRYLLALPNGDLLVSEPAGGKIDVLRGVDANGAVVTQSTYASGLTSPYGMALYPSAAQPQSLYVANTSTLVRFPYALGDTTASAAATTLATDIPNSGNHTTRALVFTQEATPRLLISVGSASNYTNTDTDTNEYHRADVLAYSVDGVFQSIYASGLRNPVGLVLDASGRPWTSVNERDGLGDDVPSDYVTHVQEGGFYGWPWYYNGANPEPRLPNAHPELATQTIVGDTLLQAHFAPLQINFYTGTQFPTPYRGDLFVASHGSWNKAVRGGYEVVRVRMANGNATGEFEDFMTGFVNPDGTVWGRPAGVAVGADGALYVADDASNTVWRVVYTGQ